MTDSKYVPTTEVASLFSVTIDTVRRWIREGELKASKINGYWRVSRDDLQEFADKKFEKGQF